MSLSGTQFLYKAGTTSSGGGTGTTPSGGDTGATQPSGGDTGTTQPSGGTTETTPSKGDELTVSKGTYEVTKADAKSGTVAYTGTTDKKAKTYKTLFQKKGLSKKVKVK